MAILLFYLFRIQESGFRIHWFFLFSSGYISITWLVSFKFIAGSGHQLKVSHRTFWFLHCSWTKTTSWQLVACGRKQNEIICKNSLRNKNIFDKINSPCTAMWNEFCSIVPFTVVSFCVRPRATSGQLVVVVQLQRRNQKVPWEILSWCPFPAMNLKKTSHVMLIYPDENKKKNQWIKT